MFKYFLMTVLGVILFLAGGWLALAYPHIAALAFLSWILLLAGGTLAFGGGAKMIEASA